jgi:hypothetical protein
MAVLVPAGFTDHGPAGNLLKQQKRKGIPGWDNES